MKKNYIYTLIISGLALAGVSCSNYLDTLPDNRTELNTPQKLSQLLASAYPTVSFALINEIMSDNTMDNGKNYDVPYRIVEEAYLWKEITDISEDSPQYIWEGYYKAIAAANHVLEYIHNEGDPQELSTQKGEALICRAYAHFILVNIFCKQYEEMTCETDLGIPYVEETETIVSKHYERGTVKEVYEKIEKDLKEALPLIDDAAYSIPKYHFNKKAAHAFAVHFYLYKRDYEQVIEYANKVLGSDPTPILRDYNSYKAFVSFNEVGNAYISEKSSCNLLLKPAKTLWTRIHNPYKVAQRYGHSRTITENETYWSDGIWENTDSYAYTSLNGINPTKLCFAKLIEYFEYTDLVAKTGYINMVEIPFSTDEILLCRAEAYIYTGRYDNAVKDLETWNISHGTPGSLTQEDIIQLYGDAPYGQIKKKLNPTFTLPAGELENLVHCLLHVRRCETMHEGLRWFDIKRYGIEIVHNRAGILADTLKVDDPRRIVQLPPDVIAAGMQPNLR